MIQLMSGEKYASPARSKSLVSWVISARESSVPTIRSVACVVAPAFTTTGGAAATGFCNAGALCSQARPANRENAATKLTTIARVKIPPRPGVTDGQPRHETCCHYRGLDLSNPGEAMIQ